MGEVEVEGARQVEVFLHKQHPPPHPYTHTHTLCLSNLTINGGATDEMGEVEVEGARQVEVFLHKQAAVLAEREEGLHGEGVDQPHVHQLQMSPTPSHRQSHVSST